MGLIKTADQILKGKPRPVDPLPNGKGMSKRGRPVMYHGCRLKYMGCMEPHHGNGYCRKHNRAFGRYGHPLATFRWNPRCTCDSCPIHHPGNQPFQKVGKRKNAPEGAGGPAELRPKGYVEIPGGQRPGLEGDLGREDQAGQ